MFVVIYMTFALYFSYEYLSAEGNFMLHQLFGELLPSPSPEDDDINATQREVCSYFSQLSTLLKKKLVEKYRIDFELFGYTPTEYMKCEDDYILQ